MAGGGRDLQALLLPLGDTLWHPPPASSTLSKCSLVNIAHSTPTGLVGQGGYIVQKNLFWCPKLQSKFEFSPADMWTLFKISLTLLGSIEEGSVFWGVTNFNYFGTSQELHDEAGGDNGRDTQLHQCALKKEQGKTASMSLEKQHIILRKWMSKIQQCALYTNLMCFSLLAAFNFKINPQISMISV